MNAAAPAPELRDIHLPAPPSWWPPAPGWWLLALVALAAAVLAVRWLLRRRRERRWRRRVRAELERIAATHAAQPDFARLAAEVSQLLRRAALVIERDAAGLRGEAWLAFLDARLPPAQRDAAPFRSGPGRALVDAPFRRVDDPALADADADALIALARGWLAAALPRRKEHA
ncbi:MAG TPA: DUF4381 family protein [Dokdonella sp.]